MLNASLHVTLTPFFIELEKYFVLWTFRSSASLITKHFGEKISSGVYFSEREYFFVHGRVQDMTRVSCAHFYEISLLHFNYSFSMKSCYGKLNFFLGRFILLCISTRNDFRPIFTLDVIIEFKAFINVLVTESTGVTWELLRNQESHASVINFVCNL